VTDTTKWADGQRLALLQLRMLAEDGGLQVIRAEEGQSCVRISISIPLDGVPAGPGIKLRQRETFTLLVCDKFPLKPPSAIVRHVRWAGTPHVQWGQVLCLYAAPSTEWIPSDGMRGLVERLLLWLERASAGTLDGGDLPVHPPVAYTSGASGHIVVRTNLGDLVPWQDKTATGAPALLVALCVQHGDRLDVVRWMAVTEFWARVRADSVPSGSGGEPLVAAPAVLLTEQIGFEYPQRGVQLLNSLAEQGMPREQLLGLVAAVAYWNVTSAPSRAVSAPTGDESWPLGPGGVPQFVIAGTPSREVTPGHRVAHLVAWRLDDLGGKITSLVGDLQQESSDLYDDLRAKATKLGLDWLDTSSLHWAQVLEDRPETTHRRDDPSAAAWLRGKRVLVFGAGALGAPIAEACARAGAVVSVVDNGVVTPGILVRQPYDDADLGRPKAAVLAERLSRCRADAHVDGRVEDAVGLILGLPTDVEMLFDLVIDATADAAVRTALELHRAKPGSTWPASVTALIGHQARRGVIAIVRRGITGGWHDVLRKLGIAARSTHAADLADIAADLYPTEPQEQFLPEPGCSAPTFIGSQVECLALATGLLNAGLDALTDRLPGLPQSPLAAAAVRLDSSADGTAATTWLGWPEDHAQRTIDGGLQVRITNAALAVIRAEARRGARLRGALVETGGMLLGEIDEAAGVVFVDVATPPAPDSLCGAVHFEHGVEGSQDVVDHHVKTSGGLTRFIGMWHTHPRGPAFPSPTDEAALANLVTPILNGPPQCLMLIVGGEGSIWDAWLNGPGGPRPRDVPASGP